ncbi:MAG: methionyl-tRNA formyltransferase [Bacteroidia bacterium]|nr:methionyl-tRNA formyltransferase [Bacteroidia bacterium]
MGNNSREEKRLNVVFLGNHDVGIKVIEALHKFTNLVGVVAHPLNNEEGVVYSSVYEYTKKLGIDTIRGKSSDETVFEFIYNKDPDLIWVTDYKYLLPEKLINIPRIGCVNLHPSLLPKYRGRAPINWAIINGEEKIGITAHFIDEGVDSGDIIRQIEVNINEDDYVGDILIKLYPLYFEITKDVISDILENNLNLIKQKHIQTKIYPRRKPEDGLIDWNKPSRDIYNLIRAVSKPYPGAFSYLNHQKIVIWKAKVEPFCLEEKYLTNGEIVDFKENYLRVKCSDGIIKILDWEILSDNSK